MWDHDLAKRIAGILGLIADPPNLRSQDHIQIFDGGKLIVDTGHVAYEFDDGSRAFYGTGLNLHLCIRLATGEEVNISITGGWPDRERERR